MFFSYNPYFIYYPYWYQNYEYLRCQNRYCGRYYSRRCNFRRYYDDDEYYY